MDLVADGLLPDAAVQLGLEEAIVRCAPTVPTLRLWSTAPAVVVGRFQDVGREVALDACLADRVAVVRRVSGGGTVVADLGTLNVSLTSPGRVLGADRVLAGVLQTALGLLGLPAQRHPRGVFVHDRKISGLAVLQTAGATLAHATLLVSTPAEVVGRYLAAAPDVASRRDSHRAPTASLREHGLDVDVATVAEVVRDALGEPLRVRPLTGHEREAHEALMERRYRDPQWHLTGRPKEAAWTTQLVSSSTGRWS